MVFEQPHPCFPASSSLPQGRRWSSRRPKLLEADRQSGRLAASQPQLARALGKSKRAIGHYVTELQVQGLCRVEAAKNQHAPTRFEICDAYWPYRTSPRENQANHNLFGLAEATR